MTTAELKALPDSMWIVDAIYTTTFADDSVKMNHVLYGPYSKEPTAKRILTWARKLGRQYEGEYYTDTLNPGYLTVEVEMLETQTNWVKSDK